jgi:coenzyme F420-0:L-glutamate ligase
MNVIALKTPHIILANENLFDVFCDTLRYNNITLKERSVIVMAETMVAATQGIIVHESSIKNISDKAKKIALDFGMDEKLVQLILNEATHVIGGVPGVLLTEKDGILIANSGIDKSNAGGKGFYTMWPREPFKSMENLLKLIKQKFGLKEFGLILSDSRVQPMKRGVIGVAIGVAGFEPLIDCRGREDLFGNIMRFEVRAIADQLADAAHVVMGECDERTPFVLIEDAPVNYTDNPIDPKAMLIPQNEDLFIRILKRYDEMREK